MQQSRPGSPAAPPPAATNPQSNRRRDAVSPQRPGSGVKSRSQAKSSAPEADKGGWLLPALIGSAAALGAATLYNVYRASEAERRNPPIGRFVTVDGVRLHYIERGQGEPVVLIHGNGTMIQDFTSSGLVDRLAERYRVIVFDRPGYGYSERPRGLWTPRAHARLFDKAIRRLGIEQATVLGHSWGTMVAVALALQSPELVRGLVLVSGYYYPTARADVVLLSPPAIPVIGDAMRYTISPLVAGLARPALIKRVFQPDRVPRRFDREFPKDLMLRPSQLRAAAEDAALMTPAAAELRHHYGELKLPVAILAGGDDQIADVGRQSRTLHEAIPGSEFEVLPGHGHMVHHFASERIADAVDRVSSPNRA
jgi:pimeloyl-ACP methyl ester carboxylesterase